MDLVQSSASLALVVPSNREGELRAFLSAWAERIEAAGVRAYVVEDGPAASFDLGPAGPVARPKPVVHVWKIRVAGS